MEDPLIAASLGRLCAVKHGLLIVVASHCGGFSSDGAQALGARASVVEAVGGQEEKGRTEDEMARWHHRLDGREFE